MEYVQHILPLRIVTAVQGGQAFAVVYLDMAGKYPGIQLFLRGDSGFATPALYKQCEENGTRYAIRLKENAVLREKASCLVDDLDEITKYNKVDYAVVYGEFMYQAGPWPYERRVVCKVEKPENQMTYMYTFVVTNMD